MADVLKDFINQCRRLLFGRTYRVIFVIHDTDFLIIGQRKPFQIEVGNENHEFMLLCLLLPSFEQISETAVGTFKDKDNGHPAYIARSRNVIVHIYRTVGKRRIVFVGELAFTHGKHGGGTESGAQKDNGKK